MPRATATCVGRLNGHGFGLLPKRLPHAPCLRLLQCVANEKRGGTVGKRFRTWCGLVRQSDFVKDFIHSGNMRAAIYMSALVVVLEAWMILSLAQSIADKAAAGTPRDLPWIIAHGAWYVVLLGMALAVLINAIRFARGKTHNTTLSKALLVLFSLSCLAFGIHYGNNSYVQGEQMLAFVTMTMFVFGIQVWKPVTALLGSIAVFGAFYLIIDHNLPATYGTQVNLFTLWISTFVVSLAAYRQKVSEATKAEGLVEANERLTHIATYDELTGIPNMHTFRSAVEVLFEGTDELGTRFSILYLDIENFKAYNEKHGFPAGDELLRTVAQELTRIFDNELVARFSDDHFVALCSSEVVEERINASQQMIKELRGDVRLHLKAGVYEPKGEVGLDVALSCDKARIACGSVKRHADQVFCTYDDALDAQVLRRQYIINNVKTAVAKGWIEVYYQPVVRCADGSGELCGYEALARWNDPQYGLLPPFAFIETLEEHREIDRLDRCIIEQVCRDLRAELDAGATVVPVSLNFSRLDFELYDVPEFLLKTAQKYGVPSSLLDVEITESALTEQLMDLQRNMSTLRDNHFSLWLDDFGSGYSSLNVLKDFKFNVLKIDMAFLRGFSDNPKSRPILKAIVDLAQELGMVTLCEGVETREQFEFLHSIGCDRAQGYFFGKPTHHKAIPTAL